MTTNSICSSSLNCSWYVTTRLDCRVLNFWSERRACHGGRGQRLSSGCCQSLSLTRLIHLSISSELYSTWAWRDERWEMWKQLCLLLSRGQRRSRCLGWLWPAFSTPRWTKEWSPSSSLNKMGNVSCLTCLFLLWSSWNHLRSCLSSYVHPATS